MAQTWNDVLKYIKINLGVPLNQLEISDDDLVENLNDHVLTVFSQYAPAKKFKSISERNQVYHTYGQPINYQYRQPNYREPGQPINYPYEQPSYNRSGQPILHKSGQPIHQFRIPLEPEEYIIDVLEFYFTENYTLISEFTSLISTPMQAIDVAIWNSYSDIVRSLQKKNTWEFLPPDILIFDDPVKFGILVYNTVHKDLSTIEPDKYHLMFKKLCLANTKLWVASMRSKFENLTTPFGPINLAWEKLQQEGAQATEEVMQLLNMIPPDFLVHIDV